MSEEAIRVSADGREEVVSATENNEAAPGDYYLCNGIGDHEIPCRVLMTYVARKSRPYFSVKGGRQHVAGCDCDKRRETRVISTLNRIGQKLTQEDIYAALSKGAGARGGGSGGRGGSGGSGGGTEQGNQKIDHRPIMRVFSDPRSLRLLIKLLVSKAGEGDYGGISASDWLMDGCGVAYARENGIEKGSLKIAFAEKTTRWKEFSLPIIEDDFGQERVVLVDAYSYEQGAKPIFYIVEMTREMAKKIFEKEPAKYVVAIFSRWYPYGTEKDVYLSARESDSHIAILRRSDLSDLCK